jgi:hypothetical protein
MNDLKAVNEISLVIKQEADTQNSILTKMENAFQRISQATGVTSLDEMVEKFLGQDSSKVGLEEERSRTEKTLNDLNNEKNVLQAEFNMLKAQGVGNLELNKEAYKKIENQIYELNGKGRSLTSTVNNLNSLMLSLEQGAIGLKDRLILHGNLLEKNDLKELQSHQTGNITIDILSYCQVLMQKMVDATSDKTGSADFEDGGGESKKTSSGSFDITSEKVSTFNIRVRASLDADAALTARSHESEESADKDSLEEDGALSPTTSTKVNKANYDDQVEAPIVDRRHVKRESKKLMELERKKNEAARKAVEEGEEAAKNSGSMNSPQAKKKQQELATQRLLTAGAKNHKPADLEDTNPSFVTQLPVLL